MRIAELFHSLQGEGMLTGVPSVFIRTAGCNLRCSWCDTKYASWTPEGEDLPQAEILSRALAFPAGHCVLTGGEPMIADGIRELAAALRAAGRHVTLETNGTIPPDGIAVDLASISPKLSTSAADAAAFPREAGMQRQERRWNVAALQDWLDGYECQLKFVVTHPRDLDEIHELLKLTGRSVPRERVMLMPEGVDVESIRKKDAWLVEACKANGFRYCQRLHILLFGHQRGT